MFVAKIENPPMKSSAPTFLSFSLHARALSQSGNGEPLEELKAVQTPVIRFCSWAAFSQYG